MTLYSFGFNGFGQTDENKRDITIIKIPLKHQGVKVLFASWETTILQKGDDGLIVWGYQPHWFDKLDKKDMIQFMFGVPDTIFGMISMDARLTCVTSKGISFHMDHVKQAVYCMDSVFVLFNNGIVQQYNLDGDCIQSCVLKGVETVCSSKTHVLFSMKSSNTPLFGLGSNRLSQLGFDYQSSELDKPEMIEYFNALGTIQSMDCGSFHSAVIIHGDVYTFGWNKDGRLGWGITVKDEEEQDHDIIRCAVFLDNDGKEIEVNAIKVVCGTSHTLVLDDKHTVWSCGSNKYYQLGREIKEEYDPYFRRCDYKDIIDITSGDWNSFLLQQ